MNVFLSLLIKLYISSVVKTKIGANHFNKLSKIIFKTINTIFLFFEFMLSQYKRLFLYQNKMMKDLKYKNLKVLYIIYENYNFLNFHLITDLLIYKFYENILL